jgi:transposase-like protein
MGKPNQKVNPERQRARFTKEFKLEVVRLLELGQKPATQLALEWPATNSTSGKRSCIRRVPPAPFVDRDANPWPSTPSLNA